MDLYFDILKLRPSIKVEFSELDNPFSQLRNGIVRFSVIYSPPKESAGVEEEIDLAARLVAREKEVKDLNRALRKKTRKIRELEHCGGYPFYCEWDALGVCDECRRHYYATGKYKEFHECRMNDCNNVAEINGYCPGCQSEAQGSKSK